MRLTLPEQELMSSGHKGCQGCGGVMAMRYALKALGEDTIVVIPACCWTVLEGEFPYTSLRVPLLHTAFETAASASSGVRAALRVKGKDDVNVMAWAGDGGTFDIGMQALSGAVERNEDFIYVCYDNEGYMNTGIQRSSSTPYGAWTTTTPVDAFEKAHKKNMVDIMVSHDIPYAATASIAYPEDLIRKLNKAKSIEGAKFIHILAPCPSGWRCASNQTVKLARLAVETNVFPLYEVEHGKYTINRKPRKKPAKEYLSLQGRFRHISDEVAAEIQEQIDAGWEKLLKKEKDSME
ncbi:3-methyl-2-oxobutanoate dehydrogenase subunit beta [Candidatus Poribacteria bacterium]|nr:3-methyl-2-oxobutanoate dehydrogenase subunit beta [Candidatus Poribacteria bacterium]